jgi:hypothetical protein
MRRLMFERQEQQALARFCVFERDATRKAGLCIRGDPADAARGKLHIAHREQELEWGDGKTAIAKLHETSIVEVARLFWRNSPARSTRSLRRG